MVDAEGGAFAYVADADEHAIHVVDLADQNEISITRIDGRPEQLLPLPDGRVVVTVADGARIEVLEARSERHSPRHVVLEPRCARMVATGPFGLAATPSHGAVLVTSDAPATLTTFAADDFSVRATATVARSPRGVLAVDDDRAFVSHLTGARVSVVDLRSSTTRAVQTGARAATPAGQVSVLRETRSGSQGYSLVSATTGETKRVVVPMVSVDPGSLGDAPHLYYGPPPIAGVAREEPHAALVDPATEKVLNSTVVAPSLSSRADACLLPRASVFNADNERVYVACLGNDILLELDGRAADPMNAIVAQFRTPRGPSGVADAGGGVLVVYAELAGALSVLNVRSREVVEIPLARSPSRTEAELEGRELFYRTGDTRITADGLGCASCHPEGREDGQTWSTPEGLRQTLPLAGRLKKSAPYGWARHETTLTGYIVETSRRLGGAKLGPREVAAIATYLEGLEAPPAPRAMDGALVGRGEAVFQSTGCERCHTERGRGTSASEVSIAKGERFEIIDTPSLLGVGRTAPYYHDGRYPTLAALLADPHNGMVDTSKLSTEDARALVAYLEQL